MLSTVRISGPAVSLILRLGQGTRLVKLDLKNSYRIVPVYLHDHSLLALRWEGSTYADRSLPFGLRSTSKIFTAVVDVLAWALHCNGIRYVIPYLDDFLLLGSPEAERALTLVTHTFHTLGIPVANNKTEGPATELSFLGILIDTDRFQLRLPAEKLTRLRHLVSQWRSRRACTRKELEHAAMVIRFGRIFLQPLFALLSTAASQFFYPLKSSCSR